MKPILPTPDWLKYFCLEDLDKISQILSQLRGNYETSTNQSYTNFILNLEKEIEKLLINTQLTWEQIFDLWEDQRVVREAIMDDYITFYC
jgi:hypothetical protein